MAVVSGQEGILRSARGLLATAIAIAQNRLELLATELQEERERLLGLAGFAAAAMIFLSLGIIFLAVFLTVLFWDSHRLLVLGIFSALFFGAGLFALAVVRQHLRRPAPLFAASLGELARDRAALRPTEEP